MAFFDVELSDWELIKYSYEVESINPHPGRYGEVSHMFFWPAGTPE
jgi:hypothetical protein